MVGGAVGILGREGGGVGIHYGATHGASFPQLHYNFKHSCHYGVRYTYPWLQAFNAEVHLVLEEGDLNT